MLAPLPGVKVAGADVVADAVADLAGAEPVGLAGVVLLTFENGAGAGAGMVMVIGGMEAGADEAAGAEVEAGADAATAEPLGFVQAMVSM
jgi:hypothetical protein